MKVDDDIASLRWLAREFDALSDDCLKIFSDPNQIKNDSLRRCFVDNPANPSNPSNPDKQKEQREQRERLISEIESQLYKPAFCESNSGSTDAPNQVVSATANDQPVENGIFVPRGSLIILGVRKP